MNRFIKHTAALFGIVTMGIMGLVGFYSYSLPNFYYVQSGEPLTINAAFSISSKTSQDKVQEANSSKGIFSMNIDNSETLVKKVGDNTLMLFDSIPIKDVKTGQIDRPSLVPCGQPFGIKLITDGVMVIELQKMNKQCPASECGIIIGDIITSINGKIVTTNEQISEIISKSKGEPCTVVYKRNNEEKKATLTPILYEGSYKAGIWVRDSSAGIGTLTFYNPESGAFGGLGHPICDADTKIPLPLSEGTVGEVNITGCNKSSKGQPGQLLGEFASSEAVGKILSNNQSGVFGTLNTSPSKIEALDLGFRQEIKPGKAYIYTTIDTKEPQKYEIEIQKIDLSENAEHDMIIKITDKELLEKTGGIVQGMSGSPIIQDNKIVGAVTHVFVDDPQQGYAIFADSMYQESNKAAKSTLDLAS